MDNWHHDVRSNYEFFFMTISETGQKFLQDKTLKRQMHIGNEGKMEMKKYVYKDDTIAKRAVCNGSILIDKFG